MDSISSEEVETVEFISDNHFCNYVIQFIQDNINNYLPELKDRHLMRIYPNHNSFNDKKYTRSYLFNYQKGNESQLEAINQLREKYLQMITAENEKTRLSVKRSNGYLSE